MAKYYAVKTGRKPGIYTSWEACKNQVDKFPGAVYKSFASEQEAKQFIKGFEAKHYDNGLIAYVDGSFNNKTKEYGYGCVFIDGQTVVKEVYGKGKHPDYVSMRNVSGEILGSEVAVKYAIENNYPAIYIYFDYEGIEKWALGVWKANKPGTIKYAKMMQEMQNQIAIHFIKVAAHTGDTYNERADKLAKKAVGIK